jgi:hypothetical protein
MRVPRSCFFVLGLAGTILFGSAAEPANPHANASARAVLDYFYGLAARKEKRVLSGQFTDFGNGANLRLIENIHTQTGYWPALIGVDYADFGKGGLTFAAPNRTAIEYWRQGGLVTISAHLYNPANRYVDLVGLDAYTDFVDTQHIKGFAVVAALGKPVGFSEYGPHGPQNPPGDFDYRRLLEGIAKDFPPTVFFMSWNGKWSLGRNPNAKELLDDPRIANREDLPATLFKGVK